MKFESKFGLNEVVLTKRHDIVGREFRDDIFKVQCIIVCNDGVTSYACRHSDGRVCHFAESELIGDPEYNQALGRYENSDVTK